MLLLVILVAKWGTKIWPVSLALLLMLPVHGIRVLLRRKKRRHITSPEQPPAPPEPAPATEQDLLATAFGLLQRRITEQLAAAWPGARWVWDRPGARERFAAGEPLTIQLNRAGGYQSAAVEVCNLQFCGLTYLCAAAAPEAEEDTEEPTEKDGPESIDYGLLAFEWGEANLQHLNSMANDARTHDRIGFHIPAEKLPHGDSWNEICRVLLQNGFDDAEPVADGILIRFKTKEKETETA